MTRGLRFPHLHDAERLRERFDRGETIAEVADEIGVATEERYRGPERVTPFGGQTNITGVQIDTRGSAEGWLPDPAPWRNEMMRHPMRGVLMTGALVVLFAGTALATDRIGPSENIILSEGLVTESVHFNTGDIKFQTKKPVKIFTQKLTFPANSTSGWHAHPGVVMVSVTSGELRHYASDCSFETVMTGGAFVESGDHATMVHSDVETVVHVTYVVPEGTTRQQLRIPKDDPGCPGNLH